MSRKQIENEEMIKKLHKKYVQFLCNRDILT